MFCDVFAGLVVVGSINANRDTTRKETTIECKTPLWRIEPNDVNGSELIIFEGDQCLGELEAFFIILAKGYGFLRCKRPTQAPVCFEEKAKRLGNCLMTRRNSSMSVVGMMEDDPYLPMRMGSSVLKSSVQIIFLVG